MTLKLVIFGGGSSYTPELVDGLIRQYETLPVTELCLTDINEARLEILGGLTRRMFARAGLPVHRSALDGSLALQPPSTPEAEGQGQMPPGPFGSRRARGLVPRPGGSSRYPRHENRPAKACQ